MTVEDSIREAIVAELQRQVEISDGRLKVSETEDGVTVDGPINLDDLVMVVMGSVAGGP